MDPRITEEFAGAAYRFGHTIVSDDTERLDNLGNLTGPRSNSRTPSSCRPTEFNAFGGADGFLRHLAADPAQTMDARIVDGLRNFLFDPPVEHGLGGDQHRAWA